MIKINDREETLFSNNNRIIVSVNPHQITYKEFFIKGITDISLEYCVYMKFQDGSSSYDYLYKRICQKGTKLIWKITQDRFSKANIMEIQIKGSNSSGVVFTSSVFKFEFIPK